MVKSSAAASVERFTIYRMASHVLSGHNREERAKRLAAIPDEHREAVEKEARRVFEFRKVLRDM